MVEKKNRDVPYDECCAMAKSYFDMGARVFQKWTCDGCGDRVTASKPNAFYKYAMHEDCGHITNIMEKGCGFMLIMSTNIMEKG